MSPSTPAVTSDARLAQLSDWLASLARQHAFDPTSLASVSADASARRYFRMRGTGPTRASLIAMDAPPPEKCREFAAIAELLAAAGIHAPHVLEADFERGFMLLTDLGAATYLDALTESNARALMRDALDTLIRWQLATRAGVLPVFDGTSLRHEMELMPEWYLGRHLDRPADAGQRAALDQVFQVLTDSALAQPQVFMHRDFMPRNLMVATPNPGVLDFQDAVVGPIAYDVVSLLRDAFLSWDEAFQLDCIAYYWERAKLAGLPVDADFGEFYRQFEWIGLQRHLKIIGLFPRIYYRDGKPRYLADLPRFLTYAHQVATRYRPLAPLARLLDDVAGTSAAIGYTF